MAVPYDRILSSPTFKFIVGPQKKSFTVHTALIIRYSKPLTQCVEGPWEEAKEGCASLKDTDEGTFVRFIEFTYRGDYTAEGHEMVLDSNDAIDAENEKGLTSAEEPLAAEGPTQSPEPEPSRSEALPSPPAEAYATGFGNRFSNSFGVSFPESKKPTKKKKKSTGSQMWESFRGRRYYSWPDLDLKPRQNLESSEDYTPVFLCHARVYTFADIYNIPQLRDLALHNLHSTLSVFTLYSERYDDIVELLRYTYSNTAELKGNIDALRELVVHYTACEVEKLSTSETFKGLLAEKGELGRDLVMRLQERLHKPD